MARERRIGTEQSATRPILLDATEHLLLAEGYGAVSTRRVAKHAGLTPALVHYYFPTTDDLLIAVYRRAVEKTMAQLRVALASERPLRALWTISTDPTCTALAMEFMAMSNHRKEIRAELASSNDQFRAEFSEGLKRLVAPEHLGTTNALGMTVLMAGVSRLLVVEHALGITFGHEEANAAVEAWLDEMEKPALTAPALAG